MMEKNVYLNEEKYQNNKGKIEKLSLIVLIIGVFLGGSLIATGLIKQSKINSQYSEESQLLLKEQIATEKNKLENQRNELLSKGIKYSGSAKYTDGEEYDLYIITKALDPSFDYCAFDEYKNNVLTAEYCSLKNNLEDISTGFNKSFDSHRVIPFYMFGAFIIIASCMIAGYIFMFSKQREILAFTTQQVMPIAKEGIEEVTPILGKTTKEIVKGIKDGLKDEE